MNHAHLLACINAAELAGFSNYASALLALYRSLPDDRAERDGRFNQLQK